MPYLVPCSPSWEDRGSSFSEEVASIYGRTDGRRAFPSAPQKYVPDKEEWQPLPRRSPSQRR